MSDVEEILPPSQMDLVEDETSRTKGKKKALNSNRGKKKALNTNKQRGKKKASDKNKQREKKKP